MCSNRLHVEIFNKNCVQKIVRILFSDIKLPYVPIKNYHISQLKITIFPN